MFTLAIGNIVQVPVKFTIKEGLVNKTFAMSLTATRYTPEEREALAEQMTKVEFLNSGVFTGWADQRLVLDSTGQPAEFSPEALKYLLSVPGVAMIVFDAYVQETSGKAKN